MSKEVDAAEMTGKFVRTVHLSYDMALGGPESLADFTLEPAPGDTLTVLLFTDRIDGERDYFVLNRDYHERLVRGLVKAGSLSEEFKSELVKELTGVKVIVGGNGLRQH